MIAEHKNTEKEEFLPQDPNPSASDNVQKSVCDALSSGRALCSESLEGNLMEHEDETADHTTDLRSVEELLTEMERIVNSDNAGEQNKTFQKLKDKALAKIDEETEGKKHDFLEQGNENQDFSWEHPGRSKLSALINIFKEKYDIYQKEQEGIQAKNKEERQSIIDRLKNLYTNSEPGVNLFKAIRVIKEDWGNAGQVAKAEFKLLSNDYYHHLNQFYEMLNMNREYLEQEYEHNLEKRQHIIARAKELLEEPVQKALNELQYLHKLWKEEAEPVAEEFREKTWEEFKELSAKIHDRKAELMVAMEQERQRNLEHKNWIIEEIVRLTNPEKTANHNYWQSAIKKVEELRSDFLKSGNVPKKNSTENWNLFKQTLRNFNSTKNHFYKNLKGNQISNLEKKQQLIQTAKDNVMSEDWEMTVPLFKKLQEEWKSIGHVPKGQANKIWDEFKEVCNTFFDNFRKSNTISGNNWKENFKQKKTLLEELKAISNESGSLEQLEALKSQWNSLGKVPRDKMYINSEFNKLFREKLRLNEVTEFDLKEENLSESQLTDKARRIKNQILDLENEVATLENNLGFFSNPSPENPLLKDTYEKIDDKKGQLEMLRVSLHQIISGE